MSRRRILHFNLVIILVLAVSSGAIQAVASSPPSEEASPDSGTYPADLPEGIGADWWTTVQENIRQSEYNVTWQETTYLAGLPAAYQAPNRAQDFRTYFTEAGIRVIPRAGESPAWELGLALAGTGVRSDTRVSANRYEAAAWRSSEPANQPVSEWYVNDEKGLEARWTLYMPHLSFALSGDLTPQVRPDGATLEFTDAAGAVVLRYGPFVAADAQGQAVRMQIELGPCLAPPATCPLLLTPATPASYPITIHATLTGPGPAPDGLSPTPNWTAEGDRANGYMGWSVGTAGDVNGDGFSDVVVGAYNYDNGQVDEGRAYVFHGSASGLSLTPDWTVEGNQASAYFGHSAGPAGDVNGDGYSDIVIGADAYDNGELDEGRAYVYHGSPAGLDLTPNWTAESDQASAHFGYATGTADDVNGDGYSDVVIGAYGYDNGETDEGKAYVYHGSPGGLSPTANWTAESNQAGANFGVSARTVGDVNGDGYGDVIVGAWHYTNGQNQEGRAFVFSGSSSGLSNMPVWTAEGDQTGAFFGESAGTAGDVNGDGYADVIVGARNYVNGEISEGAAFVYYGSPSGPGASPGWMADSNQSESGWGFSVGTAGDVNGDGYADVIVGADRYDNGEVDRGRASVYYGSATGLGTAPDWVAGGTCASAFFGISVGTAGDVNGDGYADIIVGALQSEGGLAYAGAAYAYYGSPAGLGPNPGWTAESDQAGANFGFAVSTAADVNGDGYADVIVGAPLYDNGQVDEGRAYVYHGSATGLSTSADWTAEGNQANAQFGSSVGTAGDVNGDGYADAIVSAMAYDNGQSDEGRAYVFYGSAAGLSPTANWAAESDRPDAEFGSSAGTAGDVNGDGYADVIVGASYYDNPSAGGGFAYAYYGSAAGLSSSPNWTVESDQAGAGLGRSVGTAGDVNGDGYSDIIIGAWQYDNGQSDEGRAYVYQGSAAGLSAVPNWTAESDQAGAFLGVCVGTAGDVNGDGYADVIIGAPYYDNGQAEEGRAFAYYGSAGGLSTTANWSAESDQAGALFGISAGTAGDVNGDGYADVIVGALFYSNGQTSEGRAVVYHGSTAGLSTSASWTAEGDQDWARFGGTVRTAGDVNGDGYADVIVGANGYDNPETDEGQALLYYGNNGAGMSLTPRQRRADNSAPIAPLGKSDTNAFRLALLGRTPFGRGKVKLQWEIKPLGTLFDGSGTQQSSAWVDTGTAGVQLNELASSLAYGTAYHWRARLLYHPTITPLQNHSRWLTMPWNGWNEQDLRTPEQPVAGLLAVNDGPTALGDATTLTATITAGSHVSYTWALGDGSTAAGPVVHHTYGVVDSYQAVVTAVNASSLLTATTTVQVLASGQRYVYLPIVFKGYFPNPCEPNDNPGQACGPLASTQNSPNYPDDQEDWFYVEMDTAGNLQAVVTDYSATGNLLLYAEGNYVNPIAQWGQGGSTMTAGPVAVAAGRYYVRVYTASRFNTDQLYNLVVTFP